MTDPGTPAADLPLVTNGGESVAAGSLSQRPIDLSLSQWAAEIDRSADVLIHAYSFGKDETAETIAHNRALAKKLREAAALVEAARDCANSLGVGTSSHGWRVSGDLRRALLPFEGDAIADLAETLRKRRADG